MIKILIADDVAILRNSIKFMFETDNDLEVVGTAADGNEAFNLCSSLNPDIVLMDLKMPVCDGVEGTKLIKTNFPDIKVIILTTFKEDEDVQAAMKSGANGYVLKDIEPQELITTIKNTYKGLYTIHQKAFESLTRSTTSIGSCNEPYKELYTNKGKPLLTVRDKEIIRSLINGKSYKEISKTLFISEGAIRNQVSELLKKLELNDRMQLAVFAVKHNLL